MRQKIGLYPLFTIEPPNEYNIASAHITLGLSGKPLAILSLRIASGLYLMIKGMKIATMPVKRTASIKRLYLIS